MADYLRQLLLSRIPMPAVAAPRRNAPPPHAPGEALSSLIREDPDAPHDPNRGTWKGRGYFGPLTVGEDSAATEQSTALMLDPNAAFDPQHAVSVPLMTPNQTEGDLLLLLKHAAQEGKGKLPERMYDRAREHAQQRLREGKNVFAQPGEETMQYQHLPRVGVVQGHGFDK